MTGLRRSLPGAHTAPPRRLLWRLRATAAAALVGSIGALAGCSALGGPPVRAEMVDGDTALVVGEYTAVADTAGVLARQMRAQADRQCPQGWVKIAAGPNPHAAAGGEIWKIRCRGQAAAREPAAAPGAPSAAAARSPSTAAKAAPPAAGDLQTLLAAAALQAAPDLSARAARAIARAQLRRLAAAGITLTDAAGRRLGLP